MEYGKLKRALEGVLFAAGEPVTAQRLCLGLETDRATLDRAAQDLAEEYEGGKRGIRLLRLEGSYQLCSAPEQAAIIRRTLESRKPPKLSQPALEVLAVVAYFQPVTRAYIEDIRGVDSTYSVNLLTERGLIEPCGRLDVPGRPVLFRTTDTFLRVMEIERLEDLPPLPERAPEEGADALQTAIAKKMEEEAAGQAQPPESAEQTEETEP